MGRGPRSNQAISFRAMPRLMRRPKKVGQKRYSVERIDSKMVNHREPGYIKSIFTDIAVSGSQMLVREEVAAEGKDGRLCWVKIQRRVYDTTYALTSRGPLREARKMANHLNKNPLGPIVTKEVNSEGQIEIGYGQRFANNFLDRGNNNSDLTSIHYEEPPKSFDVTDPIQARQAGELFDKLTERRQLAEQDQIDVVTKSLAELEAKEDLKLAKKRLEDPKQNAEKINTAKRFSEAVSAGEVATLTGDPGAQLLKELAAKRKEKDAAGAKQSASRMKDTLRSLSGK